MPEPTHQITIPAREVAVLRDLLAHAFDSALSPDQRADARLRVCGRLYNLIGRTDR